MKVIKHLTGGALAAALLATSTVAQAVVLSPFGAIVPPGDPNAGVPFYRFDGTDREIELAKNFGVNLVTDDPIVIQFESDQLVGTGAPDPNNIYAVFENALNTPPNAIGPGCCAAGDWVGYLITMEYFFIDTDGGIVPGGDAGDIGFEFDPVVNVGGVPIADITVVDASILVTAAVGDGQSLVFGDFNPAAGSGPTVGYRILTSNGIDPSLIPQTPNIVAFGINLIQTPILAGAAVPEPTSIALLGLGLVGLGAMRRRRT